MAEDKPDTTYRPIVGLRQDLKNFMNDFIKMHTVRFEHFSELWREKKMSFLCAGRTTDGEAREFVEKTFLIVMGYFLPPYHFQVRIGGLYLLYSIYETQPLSPKAKIKMIPSQWEDTLFLQQQASQRNHLDAVFVFHKLLQNQAFQFCFSAIEMNKCLHNEADYIERDLIDELRDEGSCINKLFNYESMEQLSYLLDQYQQMKLNLAGPEAKKPDKSLDLVQGEMSEDLVVILQSFKESVSNINKDGRPRKETSEATGSASPSKHDDDTGARRRKLKMQALAGDFTKSIVTDDGRPSQKKETSTRVVPVRTTETGTSKLKFRSFKSKKYLLKMKNENDDDDSDSDFCPNSSPSKRKSKAAKKGSLKIKDVRGFSSQSLRKSPRKKNVTSNGIVRESFQDKSVEVTVKHESQGCLNDMFEVQNSFVPIDLSTSDDAPSPESCRSGNGKETGNEPEFSQIVNKFTRESSAKRKISELDSSNDNFTKQCYVPKRINDRHIDKGPKTCVAVIAYREPGKTTTFSTKDMTGMSENDQNAFSLQADSQNALKLPEKGKGADLSSSNLQENKVPNESNQHNTTNITLKPMECTSTLNTQSEIASTHQVTNKTSGGIIPPFNGNSGKPAKKVRVIQSHSLEAKALLKSLEGGQQNNKIKILKGCGQVGSVEVVGPSSTNGGHQTHSRDGKGPLKKSPNKKKSSD